MAIGDEDIMAVKTDSISLGVSFTFLKDKYAEANYGTPFHHVSQMCKRVQKRRGWIAEADRPTKKRGIGVRVSLSSQTTDSWNLRVVTEGNTSL